MNACCNFRRARRYAGGFIFISSSFLITLAVLVLNWTDGITLKTRVLSNITVTNVLPLLSGLRRLGDEPLLVPTDHIFFTVNVK